MTLDTETERKIPNANKIVLFFHCGLCVAEKPRGTSPREWSQVEAGWTEMGFQVWCRRHEVNVIHVDFEGTKHPINTTRVAPRSLPGGPQ